MDFTFLKEDQIWGKDALEVMKRYGTKVAPTDLTVILGGFVSPSDNRTSEGNRLTSLKREKRHTEKFVAEE